MKYQADKARGFTYVEVLLAMVILAGAVTSMSYALESTRHVDANSNRDRTADYLVQDGFVWVESLERSDPDSPASFGPESGETSATFDDVDDLENLIETAPSDRTGELFGSGWSRRFLVESVAPGAPNTVVASGSTNLMRVEVIARFKGTPVASDVALYWRTQ